MGGRRKNPRAVLHALGNFGLVLGGMVFLILLSVKPRILCRSIQVGQAARESHCLASEGFARTYSLLGRLCCIGAALREAPRTPGNSNCLAKNFLLLCKTWKETPITSLDHFRGCFKQIFVLEANFYQINCLYNRFHFLCCVEYGLQPTIHLQISVICCQMMAVFAIP